MAETFKVDASKVSIDEAGKVTINDPEVVKKLQEKGVDRKNLSSNAVSVSVSVGT